MRSQLNYDVGHLRNGIGAARRLREQVGDRTVAAQLGGVIAFDWSKEGVVVTLRMSQDRLAQ